MKNFKWRYYVQGTWCVPTFVVVFLFVLYICSQCSAMCSEIVNCCSECSSCFFPGSCAKDVQTWSFCSKVFVVEMVEGIALNKKYPGQAVLTPRWLHQSLGGLTVSRWGCCTTSSLDFGFNHRKWSWDIMLFQRDGIKTPKLIKEPFTTSIQLVLLIYQNCCGFLYSTIHNRILQKHRFTLFTSLTILRSFTHCVKNDPFWVRTVSLRARDKINV